MITVVNLNKNHVNPPIRKIMVQTMYGGLGRYYQLFKEDYEKILEELNEVLVA